MRYLLAVAIFTITSSAGSQADARAESSGDPLKISFVLPFDDALETAKASRRLLFVKPIYGGVDAEGARDYRCGSW